MIRHCRQQRDSRHRSLGGSGSAEALAADRASRRIKAPSPPPTTFRLRLPRCSRQARVAHMAAPWRPYAAHPDQAAHDAWLARTTEAAIDPQRRIVRCHLHPPPTCTQHVHLPEQLDSRRDSSDMLRAVSGRRPSPPLGCPPEPYLRLPLQ